MIEITFLGTGCMQPTKNRNHSAIVLSYGKENILLDCGEGTQRQMRIAGIKPAKITRIFLSHWHGDHVFGLPGLLSTAGADKPDTIIHIYGPKGTKKFLENINTWFAAKELANYEAHEITAGKFYEGEEFFLHAEILKHFTPCLGFSFIEKDKHKINVAQAAKLGLSGPILGQLQQGQEVTVKGKKIKAAEVTYLVPGKKVSYIADTVPCEGAERLAQQADLLISEGTHLDEIKEKTEKFMHLTVKQAALIASENNAKRLVITHLSQRYKTPSEVLTEAKEYFPDSVVAEDFMKIKV